MENKYNIWDKVYLTPIIIEDIKQKPSTVTTVFLRKLDKATYRLDFGSKAIDEKEILTEKEFKDEIRKLKCDIQKILLLWPPE